jgi:hypothetical protein
MPLAERYQVQHNLSISQSTKGYMVSSSDNLLDKELDGNEISMIITKVYASFTFRHCTVF